MVGVRDVIRRAGTHSQELGCWKFVCRDWCGFGGFCWFWHGCGAPDLEKFGGGRAFFTSLSSSGRFVESTARGFGRFGGWSVLCGTRCLQSCVCHSACGQRTRGVAPLSPPHTQNPESRPRRPLVKCLGVWGGGSLRASWARAADAERTHIPAGLQSSPNRALAYLRSPPSCSNS